MGFHVDTAEMKKAVEQYQKMSKTAQEQLGNAKNGMNGIINSNAMYGQVGKAIVADINNNQNAIIVGLKNSYQLMQAELQQAYTEFQSTTGESSDTAVINEETLVKAKSDIDKLKSEHREKRQDIQSIYNDIGDLLSLSMPTSTFEQICDDAKKHVDTIIQKVNSFDSKQTPSTVEEVLQALNQQIKSSEGVGGLSYTDPTFLAFANQTAVADGIQSLDTKLTELERQAKLDAEKQAKKQEEQWATDHPLENILRSTSDNIGSWWNGVVTGTKSFSKDNFFLSSIQTPLLMLESVVGFAGSSISGLAIGSIQTGQMLGGGVGLGINALRGKDSPKWIEEDFKGTIQTVQSFTPEVIFKISQVAIGGMADDFKRNDAYDIMTDMLTMVTMVSAVSGVKNLAKNATTKLTKPAVQSAVGNVADDVAKNVSGAKVPKVEIKNPLGKNIKKHISKHDYESFRKQADYLTDSQLAQKLEKNSFFNPEWSTSDMNKYVEIAYNDLLAQGKTGKHVYEIAGEKITIVIKNDGVLDTAFGSHKLTVNDFRK